MFIGSRYRFSEKYNTDTVPQRMVSILQFYNDIAGDLYEQLYSLLGHRFYRVNCST